MKQTPSREALIQPQSSVCALSRPTSAQTAHDKVREHLAGCRSPLLLLLIMSCLSPNLAVTDAMAGHDERRPLLTSRVGDEEVQSAASAPESTERNSRLCELVALWKLVIPLWVTNVLE